MERRSARRTTPRKKYTVDAFEGVPELQDAIAEDEHDGALVIDRDHHGDQTELSEPVDQQMFAADEDGWDDARSNLSDHLTDADEDGEDEDEDEDEDAIRRAGHVNRDLSRWSFARKTDLPDLERPSEHSHTRGLAESDLLRMAKATRRLAFFGPAIEDSEPVYKAKTKWASYPTLPSRPSLIKGLDTPDGDGDASREAAKWYYEDGGRLAFIKRQKVEEIGAKDAADYMPAVNTICNFLMGPHNNPKLFKVPVRESVCLKDAWEDPRKVRLTYKNGFILSLGGRVQCLDWLPDQSGKHQYLAISVRSTEKTEYNDSTAPAFTPQPPEKTSVQIWSFESSDDNRINTSVHPQLSAVLCTEWNVIRRLQWCPMRSVDHGPHLLATISTDGALRITAVHLPDPTSNATTYQLVSKAAFESRPPNTLCTCLTWLNPSRIAAGCANGCIAIWDLSSHHDSSPARPTTYSSITNSYILSIASCAPSRPSFLATTSLTGHVLLTDLSRQHTAHSTRHRIVQPMLLWSDFAQGAISVDDAFGVKIYPLRRWTTTVALCRTKSSATAIAGSPFHPHILVGTASGEVVATNPLVKLLEPRAETRMLTWFAHEWRRATKEEAGGGGISRFTEGFKEEQLSMGAGDGESSVKDGNFHTVYEKPSAVTCLAWAASRCVSGWAAVGLADGLVRVEDIAI